MSRVRREIEGLFSMDEALDAGTWPVARRYLVLGGVIYPRDDLKKPTPDDPDAGWRFTTIRALAEPETFLSFARLAARGDPPEDSILEWVHEYGLLHRRDPNRTWPYLPREKPDEPAKPNQKPLSVAEFQKEATRARKLLYLYELYRGGDVEELRRRMNLVREVSPDEEPPPEGSGFAEVYFDNVPAGRFVELSEPISDDELLDDCKRAVKKGIEPYLRAMWPVWGIHGRLTLRCPDLLSAMYFQFAALVDGKRPADVCKWCGELFEKTKGDRYFCKDACRKAAKRDKENTNKRSATKAMRDTAALRVVRALRHGTTHYVTDGTTLCGLIVVGHNWNTADAGVEVSCRNCRKLAEKRYPVATP